MLQVVRAHWNAETQAYDFSYSNVLMLTLTSAGSAEGTLYNLPAGAHVTVTEVYDGSHYEYDSPTEQETVIIAHDTVSVSFQNKYIPYDIGGHGLLNSFEFDEDDGWLLNGSPIS